MELRQYPQLGEQLYFAKLPNGLSVAIVPRKGFTKKLAYFVTDFGSIHRTVTQDGRTVTFPAGIAHFLEHKLFDMPGRDITAEFAALGAVPNAFTGYDLTAYYFSCTEHFEACLELLLEFVTTPYFTEETVHKEQGIIGQEIDMNDDSPDTRIFEQLMECMYENHQVRQPILGTRETIAEITPQVLTDCHKAFYRPDNMLLCVIGDVDPEEICRAAARLAPPPQETVVPRRQWEESMVCSGPTVTKAMEVAMPMFQLGFKCEPSPRGRQAILEEFIGELASEALFGESSPLYMQLYQEGLIDSSFGGGLETIEGMSLLLVSGDSDHPEAVQDAIIRQAQTIIAEGIPEGDFLRMKRSAFGRRIRALDSFNSVLFRLSAYHFSGFDYFDFPAVYEEVTSSQIQEFLSRILAEDRMRMCILYPTKEVTL